MKVKFITSYSTARESFEAGKVYDLEEHDAAQCVGNSLAVRFDEQPPETPKKTSKRERV
jgi:hypothetical protein